MIYTLLFMNEFEYDLFMDNIENTHDEQDWENSLEYQYLSGLCDSSGTPITTDNNW